MSLRWNQNEVTLGSTPATWSCNVGRDGAIYGCVSVANNLVNGLASGTDLTLTVYDRDGRESDYPVAYGTSRSWGPAWYSFFSVSGSGANFTLLFVDESTPAKLDVANVAVANISGTASVNISQVAGSSPNLAKETGGHLADVDTSTGAVAGLIYAAGSPPASQLAIGLTDPPQVAVTGGKAVPVKTET